MIAAMPDAAADASARSTRSQARPPSATRKRRTKPRHLVVVHRLLRRRPLPHSSPFTRPSPGGPRSRPVAPLLVDEPPLERRPRPFRPRRPPSPPFLPPPSDARARSSTFDHHHYHHPITRRRQVALGELPQHRRGIATDGQRELEQHAFRRVVRPGRPVTGRRAILLFPSRTEATVSSWMSIFWRTSLSTDTLNECPLPALTSQLP